MLSTSDPHWPCAADYLIASRQAEVASLQQLRQLVQLSIVVGGLIHALQRERGAGSIYLGSAGLRFAELHQQMTAATEQQLHAFHGALASTAAQTALQPHSRALNDLAIILHQLDQRETVRAATRSLSLTANRLHDYYTDLIRVLLSIIFNAADSASDPAVSRALSALFHFILGKEQAGQERALGGLALARGGACAEEIERIQLLIDSQQRSFDVFGQLADDGIRRRWRQLCTLPCQPGIDQLRRHMVSHADQHNTDNLAAGDQSAHWFELCTRRIDAMQTIENLLEQHLDQITADRLQQAEQELRDYQTNIDSHIDRAANACSQRAVSSDRVALGGILQQPLLELLHDQQSRLHDMEEQLQQVRSALEERKLVDRAKALLIRHRGMKEDQAHMLLRRTAMNQSRKLVDVARAVIAMVEILDDNPL